MTIKKITMPKLGESVTEGTINTWLVQVGEKVNKYDPIAEVMTDKVNAEVPSSYSGEITEIVREEGDTVLVGDLICYIKEENSNATIEHDQNEKIEQHSDSLSSPSDGGKSLRNRYSPAVVKLASEYGIDLGELTGTGLGGRIRRKDVEGYIRERKTTHKNEELKDSYVKASQNGRDKEFAITGVRKMIADNMVRSKQEIPHAWMTVEADVTEMVKLRDKMKEEFKNREGYSLTYFSFFIYAVAKALKEFPELNSTWKENKIIQHRDVNISIAVAKENELFVPVIKHVDEKSITGIAKEIDRLAKKARSNKLVPEDMERGTFTVNNTGTFGSVSSMGIINYPQVAILQVESIVKRPVIIDDMFAARDIVNLSLSLDHRILDGLICGRFLARVKELLENINETNDII